MLTAHSTEDILIQLRSQDPEKVQATLAWIRESGKIDLLEGLLQLLNSPIATGTQKDILKILSELKKQEGVAILMKAIKSSSYLALRQELLSCCWQNGLDYHLYLKELVEMVITEEFGIAFEAFTVLENLYGKIDPVEITELLTRIDKALTTATEDKIILLNDLKTIIPNIPEQSAFQS